MNLAGVSQRVILLAAALALLGPLVAYGWWVLGHAGSLSFQGVGGPLWVSVSATTIALVIDVVLGVPLAYRLEREPSKPVRILGVLARIPLGLPPLAAGIILLLTIGPYTLIGRLTGGGLVNSYAGVVLAETFVSMPYVIETARSAFRRTDRQAEAVAATFGLTPMQIFDIVTLRAAWPGLRTAFALGWLRGFGEFGATVLVAYHPYSLPVFTYTQFSGEGVPAANAVVLVTIAAIVVGSLVWFALPNPGGWLASRVSLLSPRRREVSRGIGRLQFEAEGTVGEFSLNITTPELALPLAIMGYSGSGKSMAASLLAGGGAPSLKVRGRVDGTDITRLWEGAQVSLVPQGGGLFGGYTVGTQLALVGNLLGAPAERRERLVDEFGVRGLVDRDPGSLSGGQRQLVALCRAMIAAPALLVIDEGFSAMDAPLRKMAMRKVIEWSVRLDLALVLISHDVDEAQLLAESLLVFSRGEVIGSGAIDELRRDPKSATVAELVGYEAVVEPRALGLQSEDTTERLAIGPKAIRIGTPSVHDVVGEVLAVSPRSDGAIALVGLMGADIPVELGERPTMVGEHLLLAVDRSQLRTVVEDRRRDGRPQSTSAESALTIP
jgi:molybdate transport system permease protein